ncbi:D-glycero-beta-D-manno-heptose-7-phosphate kinase [Candidatus Aminicenantes bacterium AC-335-A11]|jgi:D-beta-D-heptose 7-phosphate kinase/D-beta-D-heptose 1-phosphate adenosyltransferase|nr:D-glycero-beta-D-manno-heptose-7-phosphate kinase [SCandidatus Aminicenantes bacterium Aminicenantia_JdfR_composite]MCP2606554.1 D-glycero-beta-D-manno-heptose-7-phosphate kinase [Candidatus Aminicenantes bacterium AC-708-I09]MCP2617919.1 D-glycero-beta-D-manno-heptose-7-phosphate kinase [Candidatus Aminicenantes bacterium AC-335-A11]
MNKINFERAHSIIKNFEKKRIAILGDIMLDQYIIGKVSRISPEAPVPVVEITSENYCLGGAGNVAHNLEALGAEYLLVGVIGNDNSGKKILDRVKNKKGIFIDKGRPTIVKTRIIAHHQHVVRVDREKKLPIPEKIEKEIINFLKKEDYDGIIISDYSKGTITKSLMKSLLNFTSKNNIPVFVDPKVEHFNLYSPITLMTPNQFETEGIVNRRINSDDEIENAGREILSRITCEYLIITRGEKGMSVFMKDNKVIHIPTVAKEVYDVTGAGDTVIATASLSLLSGANILESAILANYAAGIVVGKLGTATVSREELLKEIEKESKMLL